MKSDTTKRRLGRSKLQFASMPALGTLIEESSSTNQTYNETTRPTLDSRASSITSSPYMLNTTTNSCSAAIFPSPSAKKRMSLM